MRNLRASAGQITWKRGFGVAIVLLLCAIWLLASGILEVPWGFAGDQTYKLAGRSRKSGGKWIANVRRKEPVCSDACYKAKDGVCDDGRTVVTSDTKEVEVFCDLGTDCTDCGPWVGDPLPDAWMESVGPVAFLQRLNYSMYVRRAFFPVTLYLAYTNWTQDVDVSGQLHTNTLVEPGITRIFYQSVVEACNRTLHPQDPGLVVDVGGNFGYYSLVTAALGCRVVSWEPVPAFRAFFVHAVALNSFTSRIQIRARVVGQKDGEKVTMVVPQRGIWGTAGVDGLNIDHAIDNQGDYRYLNLTTERVDSVVAEDVILMKIDVEGYEPDVYEGARILLDNYRVDNIVMEYSPGIFQKASKIPEFQRMPEMLVDMKRRGFTILHVPGPISHNMNWLSTRETWMDPLPPMEEVTEANLKYDLSDAEKVKAGTLACSTSWSSEEYSLCNTMPEGFHPKSFKSLFSHNTNIWATRHRARATPHGNASLINPALNGSKWTVDGLLGSGGRVCSHMDPIIAVLHRCRCTNPKVCGELERALQQAVLKDGLGFEP